MNKWRTLSTLSHRLIEDENTYEDSFDEDDDSHHHHHHHSPHHQHHHHGSPKSSHRDHHSDQDSARHNKFGGIFPSSSRLKDRLHADKEEHHDDQQRRERERRRSSISPRHDHKYDHQDDDKHGRHHVGRDDLKLDLRRHHRHDHDSSPRRRPKSPASSLSSSSDSNLSLRSDADKKQKKKRLAAQSPPRRLTLLNKNNRDRDKDDEYKENDYKEELMLRRSRFEQVPAASRSYDNELRRERAFNGFNGRSRSGALDTIDERSLNSHRNGNSYNQPRVSRPTNVTSGGIRLDL